MKVLRPKVLADTMHKGYKTSYGTTLIACGLRQGGTSEDVWNESLMKNTPKVSKRANNPLAKLAIARGFVLT